MAASRQARDRGEAIVAKRQREGGETGINFGAGSRFLGGDWKKAAEFLRRPHHGLDGMSPLHAAESESGAREVERLLYKIRFGLPA